MQLRRQRRQFVFVRHGGQQGLRLRQHAAGRKLLRADGHDERRRRSAPTCPAAARRRRANRRSTCEAYRYEVFPCAATYVQRLSSDARIAGSRARSAASCSTGSNAACRAAPFFRTADRRTQQPAEPAAGGPTSAATCVRALIQYLITQAAPTARRRQLAGDRLPGPTPMPKLRGRSVIRRSRRVLVIFELLLGCFCSAALPPCPPPGDPRVPLAMRAVRASDCTHHLGLRLDAAAQACRHHQDARLLVGLAAVRADDPGVHAGTSAATHSSCAISSIPEHISGQQPKASPRKPGAAAGQRKGHRI